MRLSEAIRLGAMMGPQLRGETYAPRTLGTCALGAGLMAVGAEKNGGYLSVNTASKIWPWLREHIVSPGMHPNGKDVLCHIIYLNDRIGWSREQIADWVQTIEPKEVDVIEQLETEMQEVAV